MPCYAQNVASTFVCSTKKHKMVVPIKRIVLRMPPLPPSVSIWLYNSPWRAVTLIKFSQQPTEQLKRIFKRGGFTYESAEHVSFASKCKVRKELGRGGFGVVKEVSLEGKVRSASFEACIMD